MTEEAIGFWNRALSTTLSIGVASFSLRFHFYAGATFLAQAKACYSIL